MYGWHASGASAGATGPGWRYTVGLHQTYQHPEVVIFGLAPQTMQAVLDAIVHHVRSGHRFEAGERYDAILVRYSCAFEPVDRRMLRQYLPDAVTFYGAIRFPALKCLWPDRADRFPIDSDCDVAVREAQRGLFRIATETFPAGVPT